MSLWLERHFWWSLTIKLQQCMCLHVLFSLEKRDSNCSAFFPSAFLMSMQVRCSRGSSSQWESSREVCVCIQHAELMWRAQQRAGIDSVSVSAVTLEKQVWNWVTALSIPCCFTNSYSCDNFPADLPQKIMCKLSFTYLREKAQIEGVCTVGILIKNGLTSLRMNRFLLSSLNFVKKVKISRVLQILGFLSGFPCIFCIYCYCLFLFFSP